MMIPGTNPNLVILDGKEISPEERERTEQMFSNEEGRYATVGGGGGGGGGGGTGVGSAQQQHQGCTERDFLLVSVL